MNNLDNKENTATHQPIRIISVLTYLGVIPFLFAVFLGLSPYIFIPEFLGGDIVYSGFKAKALIHSYAVVILAFLAGIQRGLSLKHDKPTKAMYWLSWPG